MLIIVTGSIFLYLPPYARENKNHLDDAGIEPGPPAWQATALSITPCLSGCQRNMIKKFLTLSRWKTFFIKVNTVFIIAIVSCAISRALVVVAQQWTTNLGIKRLWAKSCKELCLFYSFFFFLFLSFISKASFHCPSRRCISTCKPMWLCYL